MRQKAFLKVHPTQLWKQLEAARSSSSHNVTCWTGTLYFCCHCGCWFDRQSFVSISFFCWCVIKIYPTKTTRNDTWKGNPPNLFIRLPTSGWGSSGIIFHGPIKGEVEWRALVVVDAIGVVKPWQKAVAVAATQRDSESLMMSQFLIVLCEGLVHAKERERDWLCEERRHSMTILARTIELFRAYRELHEGSGLILIELQTKQK